MPYKIMKFIRKNKKIIILCSLFLLTTLTISALIYIKVRNDRSEALYKEIKPEGTPSIAHTADEPGHPMESEAPEASKGTNVLLDPILGNHAEIEKLEELLEKASQLAAGYQYDEAIGMIQSIDGYSDNVELTNLITSWENEKASLVEWDVKQTTHIFFHSLIVDPSKAFNGSYKEKGYDEYMATVSEFNQILETMYKKGYVLVTPYQLALYEKNKDGGKGMACQKLMLPKGKKAFILSIDDVSYYQYMEGDGFASRLVIDENGKPTNEMDMEDGTVKMGDFDVMPLLERFIEKHPDFSYQGARGILALTGYDGVLGYRTSESQHKKNKEFRKAHPDYDYEEECRKAKEVAEAMKEAGWLFANHSYSHNNIGLKPTLDKKPLSYEAFKTDIKKWRTEVEPVVGKTDMVIFPQGTYLNEPGRADWLPYEKSNKRYKHLKKQGIHYFFGVGGYQPWVQLTDDYFRQDRINVDGTGMRNNPSLYKQFFNPKKVYDNSRPTPLK